MSLLGDLLDDFVIVEPGLRGHALQALDSVYLSDGDRRDSWDGATEDAMAALSVALSHVEAADPTRVVSIGLSRGGGVALLQGERDRRVTAVVAMSAPTDWLQFMARPGDDWPDRISRASRTYQGSADDRSVQFYEWFLQGRSSLPDAEIRWRLISSSPLYFVDRLPPTLLHHGTSDPSIPALNAAGVSDRFVALDRSEETHRVVFHEGAGHLLQDSPAAEQTRQFLRAILRL